jgi:hypothetical protein
VNAFCSGAYAKWQRAGQPPRPPWFFDPVAHTHRLAVTCGAAICTRRECVAFIFFLEKQLCDISDCPEDLQIDFSTTVTMPITSKSARAIVNRSKPPAATTGTLLHE